MRWRRRRAGADAGGGGDHPQLISTSRHITQGWVDLVETEVLDGGLGWRGVSRVVAGDAYELRFAFPRGENYEIVSATAGGLPVRVGNRQGWAS